MDPQEIFNPAGKPITQGQPDWYTYTADFVPAPAPGGVGNAIIQIDASAQFLLTAIAYHAVPIVNTSALTWNTNPIPSVRLMITDSGSAKQLMSAPVYLNCIAGFNGWPQRLIHPRFFDKSSAVQLQITNDDGTTFGHLQIALIGFRIYG